MLDEVKSPIETITSLKLKNGAGTPTLGQYVLGDTIKVIIKHGNLLNINNNYRIEQIDINIDDEDVETINLGVTLA